MKDRATQLLKTYKSGALVTQKLDPVGSTVHYEAVLGQYYRVVLVILDDPWSAHGLYALIH